MSVPATPTDETQAAGLLARELLVALGHSPEPGPDLDLATAAYLAVLNGQSCAQLTPPPAASALLGAPEDSQTPLVIRVHDNLGLVYLRRMEELEQLLATRLRTLATPRAKPWDPSPARALAAEARLNAAQADALLRLGSHPFVILTGGPGTGKTYTVAALLRHAVQAGGVQAADIRLVAPTGRASRRIADGLVALRQTEPFRDLAEPQTIHSLLYEPEAFETLRLLIVDEASMVDLMLFSRLLEKLPADCSLVLVGDPDQLPSVEVGSVLADLCESAALSPIKVTLTEQRRSQEAPEIMEMARAVLSRSGVERIATAEPKLADIVDAAVAGYTALRDHARQGRVAEAVAAIDDLRVLCSHVRGPVGAQALSRAIAEALDISLFPPGPGALLMVTRNDRHGTGLSNGDVGVVVNGLVHFKDRPAGLDPSRLPEYSPAFATSIHKSQGSEYRHAIVVVGESGREDFLNRQLIYTAITRAKAKVTLFAKPETFQAAAKRDVTRASGLRQRLA